MRRAVAGAVDDEVGARLEGGFETRGIVTVGFKEPGACGGEAGRNAGGVSTGHDDLPAGGDQPAGRRPADRPRPTEDHGASHGKNRRPPAGEAGEAGEIGEAGEAGEVGEAGEIGEDAELAGPRLLAR